MAGGGHAPLILVLRALGLTDHVTPTRHGLIWRTDGGHIAIDANVRVAPEPDDRSSLTITTRFDATDQETHERLLDAWPVVGSLAETLVKRAARTLQHHAEEDRFDEPEDDYGRAA